MEEKDPLSSLREKIDALDMQIMENISCRAGLAQQVAKVKKEKITLSDKITNTISMLNRITSSYFKCKLCKKSFT